ncbi:hypothetical protein BKA62DRAFT_674146 [Auriculariales sp. MPI-PUGE-AT-0066]|nr:hypothetical protein BKA62DRAFT_674146 [Auriculariales sp. MPI-PUGE-AT-0066]
MSTALPQLITGPGTQILSPRTPEIVVRLQLSMNEFRVAIATLTRRKSMLVGSKTKENAGVLITTGDNLTSAIAAACLKGVGDLHVLAKALVTVALESIDEWTRIVRERGMSSTLGVLKLRADTAAQIQTFALAMQVLEEMLEIKSGIAQMILDPTHHLGLVKAKPTSDLPILSASRIAQESFKVVVRGLMNMTDDAPWPWKAIPQTMLQFASMVERALDQPQRAEDLINKISRRIAFLLRISASERSKGTELNSYVELCLALRIIIRLRIIEKVHSAKAFLLTDYIDKILLRETERMRDALQELQMRFVVHTSYTAESISASVAAIQGAADGTLLITTDIGSAVDSMAVNVDRTQALVTQIHTKVSGSSGNLTFHISNQARLPAPPFCFNGRQAQQTDIVNLIFNHSGASIVIMGPGGIGKTSLAKAVLHDAKVVWLIPDNRFFLSVEDVIDIESASKRLVEQLGVEEASDPLSAAISAFMALPRSLLIIDNLETLWFGNNAAARTDTERMIQRLAHIPSLTLIVTSRGSLLPSGVRWSNAQSAELETISLDAARETFEQLAGRHKLETEHIALDTLLASLDCVPLAVTLLGQLAQLNNAPSLLLRKWQLTKTKFIRTHGDHRESSVDISVQISLDLLSAMTGGSEGKQLLSICAHLPDGLRPQVFTELLNQFSDIYMARDLLVTFALVSIGPDEELKMLSPVRHFVLEHQPMTAGHAEALRKIYFSIAASGPMYMDENFPLLAQNVAPEYGNLSSFLLHLIGTEQPSKELFDAVEAVSEYSYWTVPSATLRNAFRARLVTHPGPLAECLQGIGRTQMKRSEHGLATETLNIARRMYSDLGNGFQEASCRCILGVCLQLQGSLDEAEREQFAARHTFIELGRETSAAECTQELAVICRLRGAYEQAILHFTSARDIFTQHEERLYAAQCTRGLALIQIAQDNLIDAESELQCALSEFETLGVHSDAARCANYIGVVRTRLKDYDLAEIHLNNARETYAQLGSQLGLANCHCSLGELYRDQGRVQEAIENFTIAQTIYEALGIQKWTIICDEQIASCRSAPGSGGRTRGASISGILPGLLHRNTTKAIQSVGSELSWS